MSNATVSSGEYSKWVTGDITYLSNTHQVTNQTGQSIKSDLIHLFVSPNSGETLDIVYNGITTTYSLTSPEPLVHIQFSPTSAQTSFTINVSATTELIRIQGIFDDTEYSGMEEWNITKSGLALEDANMSNERLKFFCQELNFDLIQMEWKDTNWSTALNVLSSEVLDSVKNVSDILIIGTSPSNTSVDEIGDNYTSYIVAKQKGYIYFDGFTPFYNFTKAEQRDIQGDGIHFSQKANLFIANLILRDVFSISSAYTPSNAVNDLSKPSRLGNGTDIANGIEFVNDNSLDFRLKTNRRFRVEMNGNDVFTVGRDNNFPTQFNLHYFKMNSLWFREKNIGSIQLTSDFGGTFNSAFHVGVLNLENQPLTANSGNSYANIYYDNSLKYKIAGVVSEVATTTGSIAPSNFLLPEISYTPLPGTDLQNEVSGAAVNSAWTDGDFIYVKTDATTLKRAVLLNF